MRTILKQFTPPNTRLVQARACATTTTATTAIPSRQRLVALQTAAVAPTSTHLLFKSHSAAMEAARRVVTTANSSIPAVSLLPEGVVDSEDSAAEADHKGSVDTRALADRFFSGQPATHEGSCGMSDEESEPVKAFLASTLNEWDCSDVTHVLELGCGTGRFSTHWLTLFESLKKVTLVEPQDHFLNAAVSETRAQADHRNVRVLGHKIDVESLLASQGESDQSPNLTHHLVGGEGEVDLVVIAGVCLYLSDATIQGAIAKALGCGARVLLLEDFSVNYVHSSEPIVHDEVSTVEGIPCYVPVLGDHIRVGANVRRGTGGTHVLTAAADGSAVPVKEDSAPYRIHVVDDDASTAPALPVELCFIQDGSLVRSKDHFDDLIREAVAGLEGSRKTKTGAPHSIRFEACSNVHPEMYSPIGLWLVS